MNEKVCVREREREREREMQLIRIPSVSSDQHFLAWIPLKKSSWCLPKLHSPLLLKQPHLASAFDLISSRYTSSRRVLHQDFILDERTHRVSNSFLFLNKVVKIRSIDSFSSPPCIMIDLRLYLLLYSPLDLSSPYLHLVLHVECWDLFIPFEHQHPLRHLRRHQNLLLSSFDTVISWFSSWTVNCLFRSIESREKEGEKANSHRFSTNRSSSSSCWSSSALHE